MKINTTASISIPSLVRQFPEGSFTQRDMEVIKATGQYIRTLRNREPSAEPDPSVPNGPPFMFTQGVCDEIARSLNEAIVELLESKIDRRRMSPERAAAKAQQTAVLNELKMFKMRIGVLSEALDTLCDVAKATRNLDTEAKREKLMPRLGQFKVSLLALEDSTTGAAQDFDTDMKELVQQMLPQFEQLVTEGFIEMGSSSDSPFDKWAPVIEWKARLRMLSSQVAALINEQKLS